MKKIIITLVGMAASVSLAFAQSYQYDTEVQYNSKAAIQPAAGKEEYSAAQSGGLRVQAGDVNGDGAAGRVLPTVNKIIENSRVDVKIAAPRDAASGQATGKRSATDFDPNDPRTLSAPRDVASGLSTGKRVQVGDLDGDGKADFVEYEIRSPRDSASGQATGKREASAPSVSEIIVTKIMDNATTGQSVGPRSVKVTVRGWDPEKKELIVGKIAGAIAEDDNIADTEVSDEEVKVEYKRPVKLFGFLPLTMNLRAIVDKDGNLKTNKPWYSFMASGDLSAFSAAVEADFKTQQDSLKTSKIQDLLQRQSQFFQTLSNVLKTRHDTVKNSIGNIR